MVPGDDDVLASTVFCRAAAADIDETICDSRLGWFAGDGPAITEAPSFSSIGVGCGGDCADISAIVRASILGTVIGTRTIRGRIPSSDDLMGRTSGRCCTTSGGRGNCFSAFSRGGLMTGGDINCGLTVCPVCLPSNVTGAAAILSASSVIWRLSFGILGKLAILGGNGLGGNFGLFTPTIFSTLPSSMLSSARRFLVQYLRFCGDAAFDESDFVILDGFLFVTSAFFLRPRIRGTGTNWLL